MVYLQLLGDYRLFVNGQEWVVWRSRNMRWLLGLLALHRGVPVDRSWLAGTLWPESTEQQALANLRLNLSHLRYALGDHRTVLGQTGNRYLSLDVTACRCDVVQFFEYSQSLQPTDLVRCMDLYQGSLMPSCELAWVHAERSRLEHEFVACVEQLARMQIKMCEYGEAINTLERGVEVDPYNETLMRMLIETCIVNDDRARAILSYHNYRSRLIRDLNVDTSPDIQRVIALARHHKMPIALCEEDHHVVRTPGASPTASTFIAPPKPIGTIHGRDDELAEICELLKRQRLVTLTGSGGVGKTRLVLEAAWLITEKRGIPVCFVELAPVANSAQILAAVIRSLGLYDAHNDEAEARIKFCLSQRDTVLILDNCEHVIEPVAAIVSRLLSQIPSLRIIATSRHPLGIVEEWRLGVRSLSLPPPKRLDVDTIIQNSAAVRLFMERACMADSRFQVTDENIDDVIRICQYLDGIPLALEMAAARTAHISVATLAGHLEASNLAELDLADSTRPSRHRTMTALIEWTYDLLSETERSLLGYLVQFAGQFHIDHIANIAAVANQDRQKTLGALYSLVDWSLVRVIRHGSAATYLVQEPVKQYVTLVRMNSAVHDKIEADFVAIMRTFAARITPELTAHNQAKWLDVLELEHSNFQAVLGKGIERQLTNTAILPLLADIAWYLVPFWEARGHLSYGRSVLRALYHAQLQETFPETFVKVQVGSLKLAVAQGDVSGADFLLQQAGNDISAGDRQSYAPSIAYLSAARENVFASARMQLANRSLSVAELAGDEYHAALSLTLAAHEHYRAKQYNEAEACLQQSWVKSNGLGDVRNMARVLTCRGNLAWAQGQRTAAIAQYYSPALATYQSLKDPRGTATSMMNIAAVSSELGKYDEAIAFNNEAESLLRKLQRSSNAIYCANIGCCVKIWAGAYEEARAGLMDCLNEARSVGDEILMAECLADLCLVSRVSGDLLGARRNFAALESSSAGGIGWPLYRAANDLAEAELFAGNHASAIALFRYASESLNVWNDNHISTCIGLNIMLAAIRLGDDTTVTANIHKLQALNWIPFPHDIGNNYGLFEQLAALYLEIQHYYNAMRTLAVADRLRLLADIEMPLHMRRTHDRLLAISLTNSTEVEYQIAREDAERAVLATANDVSAMFYRELNLLDDRYAALKHLV